MWRVSKYEVISGLYFPVFSPNTGKYGPEITPYLGTFHAMIQNSVKYLRWMLLINKLMAQSRLLILEKASS